jgi:hypothetical protein
MGEDRMETGGNDQHDSSLPMDPNVIQHESTGGLAINQQNRISYATYIGKMLDATHPMRPDMYPIRDRNDGVIRKEPVATELDWSKGNFKIFEKNY